MNSSTEHIDNRMRAFTQACTERGVKLTHQRLEVYRELAAAEEHPDAETIWRRVRARIPTIARDTVYRNLKMLAEHGLISIVGMSHERLRFDANMEHHHHFVCVECGAIRDFTSPQFEQLSCPVEAAALGTPVTVHVEVKGVCTTCRERRTRT